MSDPSLAIQNAQESALRNDASLKVLFGGTVRLYTLSATMADGSQAKFPHIIIGQDQVLGDDTECGSSSEIITTIHIYAREATPADSRKLCKQIAGRVRTVLTAKLTITGHVMDDWMFESIQHLTDPDALTAHAVITHSYLTTASA